jgi:hypothetical protein
VLSPQKRDENQSKAGFHPSRACAKRRMNNAAGLATVKASPRRALFNKAIKSMQVLSPADSSRSRYEAPGLRLHHKPSS